MTEDRAHKWTDKRLAAIESRISEIYKEAQKDVEEKLRRFTTTFAEKAAEKKKAVEAGKITPEEFARWTRTQIFIREEYKKTLSTLADEYAMVNQNNVKISHRRYIG